MSYELVRERRYNPVLAGVMSFFVPGLGQLYKGQFLGAVLWFLLTGAGYYLLVFPGLILHFFCVMSAVLSSATRDRIRVS
jgi:TM2 domain-containing membrane protein YozV